MVDFYVGALVRVSPRHSVWPDKRGTVVEINDSGNVYVGFEGTGWWFFSHNRGQDSLAHLCLDDGPW